MSGPAAGDAAGQVMPHNLYLHSSVVLTRQIPADDAGIRQVAIYIYIIYIYIYMYIFMYSSSVVLTCQIPREGLCRRRRRR